MMSEITKLRTKCTLYRHFVIPEYVRQADGQTGQNSSSNSQINVMQSFAVRTRDKSRQLHIRLFSVNNIKNFIRY